MVKITTTKKENKIKIEKIELAVQDGTNKYLPKNSTAFVDHGNILKTIAIAVRDNLPTLLIGESGTGKTSAIRWMASQTKNGLRRVNLNGGTTADELVGRLLINDKGTYWVDGILTEAMRNGDWIVLDEINAALPEVLFVLQSVMDDDGYLVLTEKDDKEIVYKHDNFRIFATCNPPEYAGTKEMNQALLSRFAICINAEFPTIEKEREIIKNHLGAAVAESEMATKMLGLAVETRKAKENQTADYAINTRDILNTLKLSELMSPLEALSLAFANKLDMSDNKALRMIAKLHLPLTQKKANAVRKAVTTTEQIEIGKTFVFENDATEIFLNLDIEARKKDLINMDLATSITEAAQRKKVNAVKGNEFVVEATYYENEEGGASSEKLEKSGTNVASVIKITEGANKGYIATILHHKDLGTSSDIITKIKEIS